MMQHNQCDNISGQAKDKPTGYSLGIFSRQLEGESDAKQESAKDNKAGPTPSPSAIDIFQERHQQNARRNERRAEESFFHHHGIGLLENSTSRHPLRRLHHGWEP